MHGGREKKCVTKKTQRSIPLANALYREMKTNEVFKYTFEHLHKIIFRSALIVSRITYNVTC